MSRCAIQRSIRTLTLGQSPDVTEGSADARPDGAHAAIESERGARALAEIPGAAVDVRAAVVDGRHHGPAAVLELNLGPARQRLVGDAVGRVEPAAGRQTRVVVPRRDCRLV